MRLLPKLGMLPASMRYVASRCYLVRCQARGAAACIGPHPPVLATPCHQQPPPPPPPHRFLARHAARRAWISTTCPGRFPNGFRLVACGSGENAQGEWSSDAAEGSGRDISCGGGSPQDIRQLLLDGFPRFLAELQANGSLDMAEAAEAPQKLEEKSLVKKCVIEFARSRPDILFSLGTPLLAPLSGFTEPPDDPSKKLRAALRRVKADFAEGEPLPMSEGGPASFQDVVRILMTMGYCNPKHLQTVPDDAVKAAVELLPQIQEIASAKPCPKAVALAAEAEALRQAPQGDSQNSRSSTKVTSGAAEESGRGTKARGERSSTTADRWRSFDLDGDGESGREGDWTCPECKMNNFAHRVRCYGCGADCPEGWSAAPRPASELKEGDWKCADCGFHNFSKRRECGGCGIRRTEGDPNFSSAAQSAKPGEWMCPDCGINNFFYRDNCFRCETPRPDGTTNSRGTRQEEPPVRPGDWECVSCKGHNFARNSSCFRCGAGKEEGSELEVPRGSEGPGGRKRAQGGGEGQPGDWTCSQCSAHNFARRSSCFRCHAERADGSVLPGGGRGAFGASRRENDRPERDFRPGDWECPQCKSHNFSRNMNCFKCDADRPEGPSTAQKGTGKAAASAGKWKCHDCNYSNSGQSRHCFRCETPRGSSGGTVWFEG